MKKLSQENQELLDLIYPDGYKLETIDPNTGKVIDESGSYHILFVKIFPTKGKHNKTVPMVQKMNPKDWQQLKRQIDRGWKLGALTGYDEFEIIHDPTIKEVPVEPAESVTKTVKKKPGPKPAEVESK